MSESVERRQALEHNRAHALLEMEDFAGAAEFRADPLPRQHLARRNDDGLLIVGIEVGLNRIADDDDGAILQPAPGGPSTVSTSGIFTSSLPGPRSGRSCHNSPISWPLNV